MRMSNAKALLGYGAFLLAGSSEAHQIWYEQPPGQPLALYYGEYDKNILEVTPGGMDRFQQLKGWSIGNNSKPLNLTLQRQAFAVAHQAKSDDSLLAQDPHYPIFDLHEADKTLKAHWTPATRWVGDLRARTPELTLDIVPTGLVDGNKAQFQVYYSQNRWRIRTLCWKPVPVKSSPSAPMRRAKSASSCPGRARMWWRSNTRTERRVNGSVRKARPSRTTSRASARRCRSIGPRASRHCRGHRRSCRPPKSPG